MNLTNWTPLNEFDRLLNRFYPLARTGDDTGIELLDSDVQWRPTADISETKDEFLIKANLPEVDKKDIEIEVANGLIRIKGERKYEKKSEEEKQHRVESFYGSFERSFSIPPNVNESGIRAESGKGVLTIHLPKQAEPEPESRRVRVE